MKTKITTDLLSAEKYGGSSSKMHNETKCAKCKYFWFARVKEPRQCHNCKRQIKYEIN
jgi:predicted Zn-ribbon and HTH transcriptional regulator